MNILDIIEEKKKGDFLSQEEIDFVFSSYSKGNIPDYQISALLMAIYFKGMSFEETYYLTKTMVESGETIDLSGINGIKLDKHSTGGVADTTTIPLISLVASCGGKIAKMSGRGLGHTGGTIDKLESIPGFKTELRKEEFIDTVNKVGAAIISQSESLVPLDKKLYALRDVTRTIDSIPLIASSVMSKKIASGADFILLDVKVGDGAFMKDFDSALELAQTMVQIGKLYDVEVTAYLTDMEEPLGNAIGNSLEIYEAREVLRGKGAEKLEEICVVFGAEMLYKGKIVFSQEEGEKVIKDSIKSGKGLLKFKEMIKTQYGDPKIIDDDSLFLNTKFIKNVKSSSNGYIKSIKAEKIGLIASYLGAGRQRKEDKIDLSVGILLNKKVGETVKDGETILTIYANDESKLNEAEKNVPNVIEITKDFVPKRKLILAKMTKDNIIRF